MTEALLEIEDVRIGFGSKPSDSDPIVRGVSLSVRPGKIVGLVGESGSGKSLTARSVLGLLPERARTGGTVFLEDRDVLTASTKGLLDLRRHAAAFAFFSTKAPPSAPRLSASSP